MLMNPATRNFSIAAALAFSVFASGSAQAMTVCADPDNLPFSKAEGPEHGLYVDLAERVAKHLKQPIDFDWYYSNNQRRALRNSILAKTCDAYFALPADADYKTRGLQRTRGFLHVAHALVAPPGFAFKSLADLKGKRVAVEFSSTPAVMLASIEGVDVVTLRNTDEALQALAKGDADVALLWGPTAGYANKNRYASRWQLTPVTGKGLGGLVAVAVRRDNDALTKDIDRALIELQSEIDALADRYGFPRGKPVEVEKIAQAPLSMHLLKLVASHSGAAASAASGAGKGAGKMPAKAASKPATKPKAGASAAAATAAPAGGPFASLDAAGRAGRERFNSSCSHCHSVDGASPMRERDLRRLNMRYGDKWPDIAQTTILEGRASAGMPSWKDGLKPDEVGNVLSFLKVIQK